MMSIHESIRPKYDETGTLIMEEICCWRLVVFVFVIVFVVVVVVVVILPYGGHQYVIPDSELMYNVA